jgi:hypothetical protein
MTASDGGDGRPRRAQYLPVQLARGIRLAQPAPRWERKKRSPRLDRPAARAGDPQQARIAVDGDGVRSPLQQR